jgi:F-type H+-transporting ATPase subunit alpha
LEAFSQLGTELDKATQAQLDRGSRLVELLKQPQYKPMPFEQQVLVIYAGTKGYLDDVAVTRVQEFQNAFLTYVDQQASDVRKELAEKKELTEEIENKLKAALTEFKSRIWKK